MDNISVFIHHLYEYRKGLRNLILFTTWSENLSVIKARLEKYKIDYLVENVTDKKINVFFGSGHCIEVLKCIGKPKLSDFTPEEDYILGIMLGYDRLKQCQRFVNMKKPATALQLKRA